MWQYLTRDDRAAVDSRLDELGARATESTPLARLRLEPLRRTADATYEFLVELQTWPGGERRILGHAEPHGQGLVWEVS
jgi:hypothetical protein